MDWLRQLARAAGLGCGAGESLRLLVDAAGEVTGVSSIVRDGTDCRRDERDLEQASRTFASAFESAPIGMALAGVDGTWLAVNASLCRLLARSEAELRRTTFEALTHPDDLETDLDQMARTLAGEIEGYELDKRYLRPDGSLVWARLSLSLVRDDQGDPLHFISQLQDISERKEAEQELRAYSHHLTELALRDPVTGLRNYRDFHASLDSELERARRHGSTWSVVLFDVEGFRDINDSAGRLEGDRVLAEVGGAIERACRAFDRAARIGGDEFALILPETDAHQASHPAERIAAEVASRTGGVSLCWGRGSWPAHGDSKELVLLRADMELQQKRSQLTHPRRTRDAEGEPSGVAAGVEHILSLARRQLGMDVAYVAELEEGRQRFHSIVGDAASFGVAAGSEIPLAESYCARMLDGRIPNAVPDTRAETEVAALPITDQGRVGSYLGVPVARPDGRLYGTLCCVSHEPTPELAEHHVELAGFLAELISDEIERDNEDATTRRSQIELAGINALLSALVARDHYTGEHSRTVVRQAVAVARRLGLGPDQQVEVEHVALLHDIGKVGIPDSVLHKRGPLTRQEWELMRQHPTIGARILAGTQTLSHLAAAIKAEHERFDGSGYPDGLAGQQIPLASRITLACDAYHAMTSDRPYRAALPAEKARVKLRAGAGTQFDPEVVEALLAVLAAEPVDSAEQRARRLTPASDPTPEALVPKPPRQTAAWEPRTAKANHALGERALCTRCGSHTPAPTGPATGASCPNCGSHELQPLRPKSTAS